MQLDLAKVGGACQHAPASVASATCVLALGWGFGNGWFPGVCRQPVVFALTTQHALARAIPRHYPYPCHPQAKQELRDVLSDDGGKKLNEVRAADVGAVCITPHLYAVSLHAPLHAYHEPAQAHIDTHVCMTTWRAACSCHSNNFYVLIAHDMTWRWAVYACHVCTPGTRCAPHARGLPLACGSCTPIRTYVLLMFTFSACIAGAGQPGPGGGQRAAQGRGGGWGGVGGREGAGWSVDIGWLTHRRPCFADCPSSLPHVDTRRTCS